MGYQTIKDGIGKMLAAKGFTESNEVFSFDAESDQSIQKKYRVERPEIDFAGDEVQFLQTLVRPRFEYRVSLGFKLSAEKQRFDYDVAQNLVDVIIAYFCNPVNYTAYAIKIEPRSIKSDELDGRLEVEILLTVIDDITLA